MKKVFMWFVAVLVVLAFCLPAYAAGGPDVFPYKNKTGQVGKADRIWNQGYFQYLYIYGASPLVFEGATEDAYETTLGIVDPIADTTFSIPNYTGKPAVVVKVDQTEYSATGATAANGLSFTVPAGLFRAGSAMRLTLAGVMNGGAGTPALTLYLDSDSSALGTLALTLASGSGNWEAVYTIHMVSLTSQLTSGRLLINGKYPVINNGTGTANFAAAKSMRVVLSGTGSDVLIQKMGLVEFLP